MPVGRIRDPELVKYFIIDRSNTSNKNPPAKCIVCRKTFNWHSTQIKLHVQKCCKLNNSTVTLAFPTLSSNHQISSFYAKLTPNLQEHCINLLTRALILDNLPFNTFSSSKYLAQALKEIINPSIKLPSAYVFRNSLLDQQYERTRRIVELNLSKEEYLNFTIDESTNITRNRVLNLCIHTPNYGAFYVKNELITYEITNSVDSEFLTQWTKDQFYTLSHGNYERVNALITDTCATQRALGNKLRLAPGLQHVFWIPCDSHGLQLLIKDSLSFPNNKKTLDLCQDIVSGFQSSPKMLASLRHFMIRNHGKEYSFTLSVITRWGTQKELISSVLRVKAALMSFFESPPADLPTKLSHAAVYIHSADFWRDLNYLHDLLQPIDEAITSSESDQSMITHVLIRWIKLFEKVEYVITRRPFLLEIRDSMIEQFRSVFLTRLKAQTQAIHIVSYLINPSTYSSNDILIYSYFDAINLAEEWIKEYYLSASASSRHVNEEPGISAEKANISLMNLRTKQCEFHPACPVWAYSDNIIAFWQRASLIAPELGVIANRLCRTPATSFPSERAFSTLNLLHNKARNRLNPARVDKLQYIYTNERVLARNLKLHATEADLIELEDHLQLAGETVETNPELFERPIAPIQAFLEEVDED